MSLLIGGLQKTSLLDYPGKIACIVFTQMCNFRCGYCHNPELFQKTEPVLTVPAFFEFLNTRKGKLDGVVMTGGDPTLHSGLYDFIKVIKAIGFCVKLDTNGTNPELLTKLFQESLIDYIAMDIKAPLEKYPQITGVNINIEKIRRSIELVMKSGVDYEFRTTVVKSQLSFDDFDKIGQLIQGAKKYYLQKFVPAKILDKNLIKETSYTNEEFEKICKNLRNYVGFVDYR